MTIDLSRPHLTLLDCFAGCGMFSLAALRAGIQPIAFSEIDPAANRILERRFPGIPNLGDIRDFTYFQLAHAGLPLPTVLSAGFPCQDVSVGSHTGTGVDGARSGLFWQVPRLLDEFCCPLAVLENVPALRTRGADTVLAELERIGYTAEAFVVGSHCGGAEQKRERVWIVAHRAELRVQGLRPGWEQESHPLAQPPLPLRRRDGQWQVEPDLRRATDAHPRRLDELKLVGNAIDHTVPELIFHWMRIISGATFYTPDTNSTN